jgi:hypothetical protein
VSDHLIPVPEGVDSGNRCLSNGDRPQTHSGIAAADVSILVNRHHASHLISTPPRRFRGEFRGE